MVKSWASSPASRATMLANRSRDTKPELALRTLLHARGLRYRVDFKPLATLRSRADIVFTKAKVAIYVDGCYWHGCPQHYQPSKTNIDYWGPKIESNRLRDERINIALREVGWVVVRVWEHENPVDVADAIAQIVARKGDYEPSG